VSRLSVLGRVGAAAGVVAGAAALGVAAQNHAARRIMRRPDPEATEEFGRLAGTPHTVLASDGTALHVEVDERAGADGSTGDDLTIVFSHGFALSQHEWHYQRRDLRDLGRLVFWDHRGHGRSGRGPDGSYTIEQIGDDLRRVLETVAAAGPVVLVGHSMGGMAILRLATTNPGLFGERVRGVVLVSTSADERGRGLPVPLPGAVRRLVPGLTDQLSRHPEILGRALGLSDDLVLVLTQHYGFGSRDVPPSFVELTRDMHLSTPVDVLGGFLPSFETYDATDGIDALHHLDCAVITGTKDAIISSERSAAIVRRLPGAELVLLEETGHMITLERYPEVNQLIRETLARVRRHLAS
jgi:pimeloyl-ACP methyl ester carboxylesterase